MSTPIISQNKAKKSFKVCYERPEPWQTFVGHTNAIDGMTSGATRQEQENIEKLNGYQFAPRHSGGNQQASATKRR
jgi:hypothetical protein